MPSSISNVDTMDTNNLSQAMLIYTNRLAENIARLGDLEDEIRRFKAENVRLEAENEVLGARIKAFGDEEDSVQAGRLYSKEHVQDEEHQELGHIEPPKTNDLREEAFKEERKQPIGSGTNRSLQIDSHTIPLREAHADRERTMTSIPTTTPEQPVDEGPYYHEVLPMSVSEFDKVWQRVKHSLHNVIVDISQMPADRHDSSRLEELLDLRETDKGLEWEVGYFRIF